MKCFGPLAPASSRGFSRRRALWGLAALSAAPVLAGTPLTAVLKPDAAPELLHAEKEAEIIAAALRYLKLSRTQLMAVLDTGRQIRRRMSMTSQAQDRARRDAEFFSKSDPAEAQRRIAALEGERAQAQSELALYGAGRLTRILDRLQIGLAWKLGQGRLPEWTKADPILLQNGGFGRGNGAGIFLLGGASGDVGQQLEFYRSRLDVIIDSEQTEGLRAADALAQLGGGLGEQFILDTRSVVTGQPSNGDGRPFPQRLAEVPDPSVLAPEIKPVAQRLFLSERLVEVAEAMLAGRIDPPNTRRPAAPSGNPRLIRQHKMEQGLRDQKGQGPELEPQGGSVENGAYLYGPGLGFQASDLGVTDHYCLQFVFRSLGVKGYQKLIDFKDRVVDGGLYTYENQFTFYTLATGGALIAGEQRVLIQRNRRTRLVQVLVDFRPTFAFVDLDDDAVFKEKKGWFFIDDKSTNNEHGPGAMRWLTVTSGPLSR